MNFDLSSIDFNDPASWPTGFKVFMAAMLCVAILVAGYWFVIKGQRESLAKLESQEQLHKSEFKEKKKLAINLPTYRQQMIDMEESFGTMLRQLPDKTEVPQLLVDITQAGLGRGLEFVLFKPQDKRADDFYAALPINLQVIGTYHQLAEFVSDLAELPRIVTLGDIQIEPLNKKDQGNERLVSQSGGEKLVMSAITRTFHYLDPDEIAANKAAKEAGKKKGKRKNARKS
jgi:type IV pilus assembly protein PilO